jgi:S1-C subfamily serine protease
MEKLMWFLSMAVALCLVAAPTEGQVPTAADATGVFRAVSPSVFLIEVLDRSGNVSSIGSAFLIDGGRLVTNAHVVEGGTPHLRTGPARIPVEVERVDVENDLAVLRATVTLDAPALRLGSGTPAIGSEVFALGNPQGLERSISVGLLSGVREVGPNTLLQVTAPVSPGSSGGPVVDRDGVVIGVTVGTIESGQNLNFAVPVDALHALLGRREVQRGDFTIAAGDVSRLLSRRPDGVGIEFNTWWTDVQGAMARASSLAVTAEDHLLIATLAIENVLFDETEYHAFAALSLGVEPADSARALLLFSWRIEFIFDREIERPRLERMLSTVDAFIRSRANSITAHAFRANVLSRLGRHEEAIASARRATTMPSVDVSLNYYAYEALYDAAYRSGSRAETDRAFREMVERGHANASSWSRRAAHLRERDSYEEAARAYLRAAQLSSGDYAKGWVCEAGRLFWIAEMEDEKLSALRACVEAQNASPDPNLGELSYAHMAMASALNDRGVYSEAERNARLAIRYDPTSAWGFHELARSLLELRRFPESASNAQEAIRLSDGRFSTMHFIAGQAYFGAQDWPRCEQAFRNTWRLDESYVSAAYNAGLCVARQGYFRDAAQWMDTVLRAEPNRRDRQDIEAMIRVWRQP